MIPELLRRELPELKLVADKPYRELTTLGVGGTLPLLAEPASETELAALLKLLRRRRIPFFILGGGSNLVGADAPYPGVGVRLDRKAFGGIERNGELLRVGARAMLPELASFAARNALSGLAPLSCIPGSVGGAVRMNASCRGTAIGELVSEVEGIDFKGRPWHAEGRKLKWRYREGGVPEDVVIISVTLKLVPGDAEKELAALEAERAKRRESEPTGRSAGCVFRNVSPSEPAGMLIDRSGLRGARIGGAQVSEKHANYIVNVSGNASESDFLQLARLVRRTVRERFGKELRPEVRFIGPFSKRQLVEDFAPPATAGEKLKRVLLVVCRGIYFEAALLVSAALIYTGITIRHAAPGLGVALSVLALLLIAGAILNIVGKR